MAFDSTPRETRPGERESIHCTCPRCGTIYRAGRRGRKYCSHACADVLRSTRLAPDPSALRDYLDRRSEFEPITGCRLWAGRAATKGYGLVRLAGVTEALAHRASWLASFGAIPAGLHVLHRCDTPACINPGHLFLGTNGDNARDRAKKMRSNRPRGAASSNAKLSAEAVEYVRENCAPGDGERGYVAMAKRFGVSDGAIRLAFKGKTWTPLRPGERWVGNQIYVFDQDAVNAYEADRALANVAADLSGLTWDQLGTLHAQLLNAERRRRDEVREIGRRICNERASRPEYAKSYGRAA